VRRPLVKVCGITRPVDGRTALAAGADLLGFVLARSPRRVSARRAAELVRGLRRERRGVRALMTGVFKDAPLGWLLKASRRAGFDLVQLHGAESPRYLERVAAAGFRVMKVIKKLDRAAAGEMERYPKAWAFLLEPPVPKSWRGTARAADFRGARLPARRHPRVGIAGNLSPELARRAVRAAGKDLWLVDAASALESAPGLKDPELVRAFLAACR